MIPFPCSCISDFLDLRQDVLNDEANLARAELEARKSRAFAFPCDNLLTL